MAASSGPQFDVLHVDDEPDFAEMAAEFIKRNDSRFSVEVSSNVNAGLDRLDANGRVDCIISDYDMPGQNGIEFLRTIRERMPDLPFILYTGKGSEEVASEAISAGVTDYLQKEAGTDQYAVLANRAKNAVFRYRAEQEAERTRARLEAIAENSNDVIITIDPQSRIQFTNGTVEDLFGYSPSDLEGQPLTSLMPERRREDHLEALGRYVETGERANDWRNVEFEVLHRDGHEVPVSISYGEFVEDGEQRFVGIIRDITARKEHEVELEQALEKFQTLVEQNLAGIYLIRDGGFEYVNQRFCEITGYDEEELTNMDVLEIIAPESRDEVEANIDKRLAGEVREVEYMPTFLRKDGKRRSIQAHGSRIELDGESRILGTVVDVTDAVDT